MGWGWAGENEIVLLAEAYGVEVAVVSCESMSILLYSPRRDLPEVSTHCCRVEQPLVWLLCAWSCVWEMGTILWAWIGMTGPCSDGPQHVPVQCREDSYSHSRITYHISHDSCACTGVGGAESTRVCAVHGAALRPAGGPRQGEGCRPEVSQ